MFSSSTFVLVPCTKTYLPHSSSDVSPKPFNVGHGDLLNGGFGGQKMSMSFEREHDVVYCILQLIHLVCPTTLAGFWFPVLVPSTFNPTGPALKMALEKKHPCFAGLDLERTQNALFLAHRLAERADLASCVSFRKGHPSMRFPSVILK